MKFSSFMFITALLAAIYGLGFLLIPAPLVALFGVRLEVAGEWLGRYLGSAFLGFGVLAWRAKTGDPADSLQAITLGFFVFSVTGLVIAVLHALSGLANALAWLSAVAYLFLTVGSGYFHFIRPMRR